MKGSDSAYMVKGESTRCGDGLDVGRGRQERREFQGFRPEPLVKKWGNLGVSCGGITGVHLGVC